MEIINITQSKLFTFADMESSSNMEYRIGIVLAKLGLKISSSGFAFLKYGIYLMASDMDSYRYLITKRLYVDIASHFNTTSSRVERAIRTSIGNAKYVEPETCCMYLGNNKQPSSYTNGELIITLAELLKYNMAMQ